MPEPLIWTDAELDAELDAFRPPAELPPELRERVLRTAHRERLDARLPPGTVVTRDGEPTPSSPWRPTVVAAAVLVAALVAGAIAMGSGGSGTTGTAAGGPQPGVSDLPLPGEVPTRLPEPGDAPLLPTADLMRTASDPAVDPGQYLYRRFDETAAAYELWIPSDRSGEWLRVESDPSNPGVVTETRAEDGRFLAPGPGEDTWPVPGGRQALDQPRDPRRLYELLRIGVGETTEPQLQALESVKNLFRNQVIPADLRAAIVGALGYVPGLRLEYAGTDATIIAEGVRSGDPIRSELRIDTRTGQAVGFTYVDETGTHTTTVTTGVADAIGEPPS